MQQPRYPGQEDPIKARKALMKANGESYSSNAKPVGVQAPF